MTAEVEPSSGGGRTERCGPGPRHKVVDPVDWMVGDLGEDAAQIGLWIEAVEDRGLDQGVEDRGPATAGVGASEQIVLAAESNGPFILPMSGRSWRFTTAGIPILAVRFLFARSRSAPTAAM